MNGVVQYLLNSQTGCLPQHFERSHRSVTPVLEHFVRRLQELTESLRVSCIVERLEWFPAASLVLVDELSATPPRSETFLTVKLRDSNGEVRCESAGTAFEVLRRPGLRLVMPLLADPEPWARQHALGLLSIWGDASSIDDVFRMMDDPDASVRGQAAYALGHIGNPRAIPRLIHTMETDHELDPLGHSPSSIAATALDNILGTNVTRTHVGDGLCTLAKEWPPNLQRLKDEAMVLHDKWMLSGIR